MTTKFKLIKQVTKKWKSGFTTFSVISDNEHIDRNYIMLDRKLIGKPDKNQFFNLHFQDWTKLKELIDGDIAEEHKWPIKDQERDEAHVLKNIEHILSRDPDFLLKILSYRNIGNLTNASFEAIDTLAVRVYEIKAENLEFLLKKLSEAGEDELKNFVSILNQLRLGQISSIAELVKKKISIIKLFETLIKQKDTKEKEIHKLLESSLWLLNNNYDLLKSNKTLSDYLSKNIKDDPALGKRPDLIVKMFLQDPYRVVLVELKRPSVKLNADHVGQVLGYKGIIEHHNPSIKIIDLFLLGYDLDSNMPRALKDLTVDILENVINRKRNEFNEFLKIIEESHEDEYDIF
jgi:hypothetical protein